MVFGAWTKSPGGHSAPSPAAQETTTAETSARSTTLPLFDRVAVSKGALVPRRRLNQGTPGSTWHQGDCHCWQRMVTRVSVLVIYGTSTEPARTCPIQVAPAESLGIVGTNVIDDLTNL